MPVVMRDKVAELKSCPHCGSTNGLYRESDRFGSYLSCRYCGWTAEIGSVDLKALQKARNRGVERENRGNQKRITQLSSSN